MRSYFVGAVTIAVVIISISTSLVEGRIGGSVEVLRRMLEDEEEAIDDQEDVDECKDSTRGSIPTGVNENLKCKKIKKLDRCEEEYDGNYLYAYFYNHLNQTPSPSSISLTNYYYFLSSFPFFLLG